jgi:hypothetical protein
LGDDSAITLDVCLVEISELLSTATYHLQQTTPRVVVFAVHPQVLGELIDLLRENGDLNLSGTRVPFVAFVLLDDFGFSL